MARLLGATDQVILPHTQIGVDFPVEKLFQPGGKPREAFVPPVYVDLTNATSAKDPILDAGMKICFVLCGRHQRSVGSCTRLRVW
jgi:carboxyl-terminal processing protease